MKMPKWNFPHVNQMHTSPPKEEKSDGRPLFEELITTFDIDDSHLLGILPLMTIIVRKVIQLW